MSSRIRGQVAVVGVGSTPYRQGRATTLLGLGLEAAIAAIEDAGIDKSEIDGICGSGGDVFAVGDASYLALQGALGIERTTWVLNSWLASCFVYAAEAVATGLCDTVLVVQARSGPVGATPSGTSDAFRTRSAQMARRAVWRNVDPAQRWYHSAEPYAAWMGRYLHDYGASKDVFGYVAINNRSHAVRNPNALYSTPLTWDEYHRSPDVWSPMQKLDMDVSVDVGEALVLTTAERARDLPKPPVYVDAMALGGSRVGEHYENGIGWSELAPSAAMRGLWRRTDLSTGDVDVFFPYDGTTLAAVQFTEAAGFCQAGEAPELFASSWDSDESILRLNGRTQVGTNGGNLSQGRSGGFGFYAEAVRQLRGECDGRQVPDAACALIGAGSFHHDPAAVLLTANDS